MRGYIDANNINKAGRLYIFERNAARALKIHAPSFLIAWRLPSGYYYHDSGAFHSGPW